MGVVAALVDNVQRKYRKNFAPDNVRIWLAISEVLKIVLHR